MKNASNSTTNPRRTTGRPFRWQFKSETDVHEVQRAAADGSGGTCNDGCAVTPLPAGRSGRAPKR